MFASRLLIAFGLVWITSAQINKCTCFQSPGQGFWDGDQCTECDGEVGDFKDKANPFECKEIEFCTDPKREPLERQCYGKGRCLKSTDALVETKLFPQSTPNNPCECTTVGAAESKYSGKYCEKCAKGRADWPDCNAIACEAIEDEDPKDICNGHGSCSDSAFSSRCGSDPFLPQTEICLQAKDSKGFNIFKVVSKGLGRGGENQGICGVANKEIQVCAWDEECSVDAKRKPKLKDEQEQEAAFSARCYPFGNSACHNVKGKITADCTPSQTCCDGECCDSDEGCILAKSSASVTYLDKNNDEQIVTIYKSMKWELPNGEDGKLLLSRKCLRQGHMSAPAAVRVVVMPIFLVFAIVASFGLIMTADGECGAGITFPAVLLVLCSLLLCFSQFWPLGLLVTLSGCVAIGGAKKGDSYIVAVALLFQFFALAVVCGGLGVGVFFVNSDEGMNSIDLENSSSPNWSALRGCSQYFGFFEFPSGQDAGFRPPNAGNRMFYGYCAVGWYGVLYVAQALMVFSQVVMIVASGVAFVGK